MKTSRFKPQDGSQATPEPLSRCVVRTFKMAVMWNLALTLLLGLDYEAIGGESTNTNDKALLLNPVGADSLQWVTLPPNQEFLFDFPGPFTVEFWLSFADWPSTRRSLISKGSNAWAVSLMPSGKIGFQTEGVREGDTGATELLSSTSLERSSSSSTNWHHVAVTYDPLLRRKSLYLNGARDAVSENLEGSLAANNLPVRFGASPSANAFLTNFSGPRIAATNSGWRFTVVSRLVEGSGGAGPAHYMIYGNGRRRFYAAWDTNSLGQLIAVLGGNPGTTLVLTNGSAVTNYHTHELEYDPVAGIGTYRFNGNAVYTSPGELNTSQNGQALWGSYLPSGKGRMNYSSVAFSTNLNNPGTVSSYTAGALGIPPIAPNPTNQGWALALISPRTSLTNSPVSPDSAVFTSRNAWQIADGTNVGQLYYTTTLATTTNVTAILDTESTAAYQGKLEEVRLWGTARSEERIRENMNRMLQGSEPGLVGLWSFNSNTIIAGTAGSIFQSVGGSASIPASFQGTVLTTNLAVGQDLKPAAPGQYSFFFNGTRDIVRIPHADSLNILTQATFEAWVRPSSLFLAIDLSNTTGLVQRLTNSQDGSALLGGFLWNQFSPSNRSNLVASSTSTSTKTSILVNELNRLIQGTSLYQADRFAPVTLRPETDALVKTNLNGSDIVRFNRLLLEDAYPDQLVPLSTRNLTVLAKGIPGYGLVLDGAGNLQFHYGDIWSNALKARRKVPFDRWSHVGLGFFRSNLTAAAKITFYLDGLPVSTADEVIIPTTVNNTRFLALGAAIPVSSTTATNYFRGELDEIRIWSLNRTDTEMTLFASRGVTLTNSGLVGYWKFDEGKGTSLFDRTGSGGTGAFGSPGSLAWTEGLTPASPLPSDLNLTVNKQSKGLWIGQVTLTDINEVHARNQNDSETLRPTPPAAAASFRILLHVDAGGQVRLLKDVLMVVGVTNKSGATNTILITDLRKLSELEGVSGVVRRGGKLVPLRQGSAAFDFPGSELPFAGGVGVGVGDDLGCFGRITLPADHPTNPFRHRFHPEHRSGYELTREISIRFTGSNPGLDAPGYGVDRLTGTYQETVTGLHKIPIKVRGNLVLNRISETGVLNQAP